MPEDINRFAYHRGKAAQFVPADETEEQKAMREADEASLHVVEPRGAVPADAKLVFDEKGVLQNMNAKDAAVQRDRRKDAAEERSARKDGDKK